MSGGRRGGDEGQGRDRDAGGEVYTIKKNRCGRDGAVNPEPDAAQPKRSSSEKRKNNTNQNFRGNARACSEAGSQETQRRNQRGT